MFYSVLYKSGTGSLQKFAPPRVMQRFDCDIHQPFNVIRIG